MIWNWVSFKLIHLGDKGIYPAGKYLSSLIGNRTEEFLIDKEINSLSPLRKEETNSTKEVKLHQHIIVTHVVGKGQTQLTQERKPENQRHKQWRVEIQANSHFFSDLFGTPDGNHKFVDNLDWEYHCEYIAGDCHDTHKELFFIT